MRAPILAMVLLAAPWAIAGPHPGPTAPPWESATRRARPTLLDAKTAQELGTARRHLASALKMIVGHPRAVQQGYDLALESMAQIDHAIDAYFHATNLREPATRPHVLAMRSHIRALQAGPDALMVYVDDALRFRPHVHLALADFAEGSPGPLSAWMAWRHLRAAKAAGAEPAMIEARLAAVCAAGGPPGCAVKVGAPARP